MKHTSSGKTKKIQILHFYDQMALMINAGIPLTKALDSICNSTQTGEFKTIIADMTCEILSGKSLSQAMGKHDKIFGNMDVCCIKLAEESGNLSKILKKLSENGKKQYENKQKFTSVITYPAIVFILSIAIIWIISQTVISQIYPTLPSKGVIWDYFVKLILLNSKIIKNPIVLLYTFIKVFLLYKVVNFLLKNKKYGILLQRKLWNLPIIKDVVRGRAFCDFFSNFLFLYDSGTDIYKSLKIAAFACDNIVMKEIALSVSEEIIKGMTLSDSFKKYFPKEVTIFIKSGEISGNLTKSLESLCKMYQQKTDTSIEMAMNFMEPAMIISTGAFTAVTALLLLSPIYDSMESLGI